MNTQEERDLTRSLQNQADQFHSAPLTFDGVTSRSRSITRRRRMVAGAGVLAAAAILVPAATFMGGQSPESTELPPATEAPSEEPSPAQPAEVQELSVEVPAGPAPRISYLHRNTLHNPDGSSLQLPVGQYWSFAWPHENIYAVAYEETRGQGQLTLVDPEDGDVVGVIPGVESFALSADLSTIAWIDAKGSVEAISTGGRTPLGSVPPGSRAVSVVGSCSGDDNCSVFFQPPGEGAPGVITPDGKVTRLQDAVSVSDVSSDSWVAAMTSATDDSSCHRAAPITGDGGFETCDHILYQFSSNDQLITADPSNYADGMGSSGLLILDRSGNTVAGWQWTGKDASEQLTVVAHAWEDNEHVLAQVYGNGEWTMLRLGADGSAERVLDPIQDEDFNPPWIFAQQ